MSYPPHIKGTWQFSGHWLGSYRLIDTNHELTPIVPESTDLVCPECDYPHAVQLSNLQRVYPLMCYCPECFTIYAFFGARCPDCDGFLWNASAIHPFKCPEDKVRCSICHMFWDLESAKEINEDPEFHNEGGNYSELENE